MRAVASGLLLSGMAGILFGVAFALFLLTTGSPHALKGPVLLVIPAITGSVAGAAGAAGAYLDAVLIRRGMSSPAQRRVVSFLVVTLSTFALAAVAAMRLHLVDLQAQALWGALLGLSFGAVFAAVEYRLWKMRQRVVSLEIENRYLSEMARKDALLAKATEDLVLVEERNRVAQDLHDSVSSGIHGIVYALHLLKQAVAAGEIAGGDHKIAGIIDLLDKTAHSTQDELRAMILELKPSLLDEKGLAEALRLHCELFSQRQNVPVDLSVEDAPGLSAEQQVAVYRIAQEALANVQRHSGATRVSISLAFKDGKFALVVADDGRGFDPGSIFAGVGLHSMEQRCARNNGTLRVTSSPGTGTRIEAVFIPLE